MAGTHRLCLAVCTRLAATQYGVISRAQALKAGLSRDAIKRLLVQKIWLPVHPATYALWTPSDPGERWCQRLMACVLWLGEGSLVSHRAASLVYELDGVKTAPLEATTTSRRRAPSRSGIVVHNVASILASDVARHRGFPVTSVPRTLVGLASVAGANTTELALESALRRGLTTREKVEAALRSAPRGQPGKAALSYLLDNHPGIATDSAAETLFWQTIRGSNLPLPVRQYVVRDQFGRFVARPDFAYPEYRLAIEVDPYGTHSSVTAFERDRERHNQLLRIEWVDHRVTYTKLTRHPRVVIQEITDLLRIRKEAG